MKDVILFADTLPSFILQKALKATGIRLRSFHFFRPLQLPCVNLESIGFAIQLMLLYLSRKLFFRSSSSGNPYVFFYAQSEKESYYEGKDLLEVFANIKKSLQLSKAPLHISELSRFYQFRRKRFFTVGAPGSGNMIFSEISNKLLNTAGSHPRKPEPDPVGRFLQRQALLYMAFVRARLRNALRPFLISDSIGPEGFGRCFFAADVSKGKVAKSQLSRDYIFLASALPLNHQAWANPLHTSHAKLSKQDLLFFRNTNTDVIQIVRHPLDNLLSITSKIAFRCVPPTSVGGRQVWIEKLLNTEQWFYTLFEAIQSYYENVCENRRLLKIIKYESLYGNPKESVQKMASYLQCSISATEATKMFSLLAQKELAQNGHRWEPGFDKWKRYIPRKYHAYLKRSNLMNICGMLDYGAPDLSHLPILKKAPAPEVSSEFLALEEIRYYILINKQPYFKHPNIKLFEDPITGLKVGGLSSHVNAVRKMVENGPLF